MAFKNPAQRAAYFESLKGKGESMGSPSLSIKAPALKLGMPRLEPAPQTKISKFFKLKQKLKEFK